MSKDTVRQSPFGIRVENRQTWILYDRSTGNEVGGVSYKHSNHGDHYQPWLLLEGKRVLIGAPLSQLGQAAREIESEILKRERASAGRD